MRMTNDALNSHQILRTLQGEPLSKCFQKNVNINAKYYKPFGCPFYVLDSSLQTFYTINGRKEQK